MTKPITTVPVTTSAKAVVAAVGSTLTAATTALAAVNVALQDGSLDAADYGSLVLAAVTLIGTVYSVWRVPNKPVS